MNPNKYKCTNPKNPHYYIESIQMTCHICGYELVEINGQQEKNNSQD